MSVFRRRRREQAEEPADASVEPVDDPVEAPAEVGVDDAAEQPAATVRPQGPWDADDAPPPPSSVQLLDLGGLRVPVYDGHEVRVEVNPEGQVVAATVVDGPSALLLNAFAAPRSEGIWDDVRAEIAASLRSGRGSAEEADGPFGVELRAQIPAEAPGAPVTLQPARFFGVDGPRWFLRGLVTGAAAVDPAQAVGVESAFRSVVVVRGGDAMAPRDPLSLVLPHAAVEAMGPAPDADEAEPQSPYADKPGRLERGPEITETR